MDRQQQNEPFPHFGNELQNAIAASIGPVIQNRLDGQNGGNKARHNIGGSIGGSIGGAPLKLSQEKRRKDNKSPPTPSKRGGASAEQDEAFKRFWAVYPKHQAKAEAVKAWNKLNPSPELVDTIITAVERASRSENWSKENGRFIPLPATYLNGQRWEDEFSKVQGVDPSLCGSFDADDMFQAALLRTKKGMGQ